MMRTAAAFCLGLALLPASAIAGPFLSTEQGTGTIWLGLSALQFAYKEFDEDGALLDREDGLLPGVRMGTQWQQGRTRLSLELSYFTGTVDYDGQTQDGTPHRTLTDETLTELNFTYGSLLGWQSGTLIYAGAGFRRWERDIHASGGVSGLYELYTWPYVMLGGEGPVWKSGQGYLSLDARLTLPVNPKMRLNVAGSGEVALDLGARPGLRIALPWRQTLDSGRTLEIAPYAELWRLGRSPDVLIPNWIIHEPRSKTINIGASLSFGF